MSATNIEESELEELVSKAEFMVEQLKKSNEFCDKLKKRVCKGDFDGTENGMSLLQVKFHLMTMYNSRLAMYMAMRARGESVSNHALLNELAIICWISDKLRNIQKQCQYSIDKLLDHSRKIESWQSKQERNKRDSSLHDNLSHKPDLSDLRPPTSEDNINNINNIDSNSELNLPLSTEMNKTTNRDEDGIYRPPKLNPVLMDNPDNKKILSKQQSRRLEKLKNQMKKSDYYQAMRDEYTTLPKEERFHLQNKTKKVDSQIDAYEEDTFKRTAASRRNVKEHKKRERYIESSAGENLDSFLDRLGDNALKTEKLAKFEAGGSFETTIGSVMKKQLKGGKYVKGPWQRRRQVLFKNTKRGKRIESRKNWRKSHPLKMNPTKALRMKGKSGRKARQKLGVKPASRKVNKLKAKIAKKS